MRWFLMVCVCCLSLSAACGDNECSADARDGHYACQYTSTSEDCDGSFVTLLVYLTSQDELPDNCTEDLDEWSGGGCVRSRQFSCEFADRTIRISGSSNQEDPGGERLTGSAEADIEMDGSAACTMTYDFDCSKS